MLPTRSEPAIPASGWRQTLALHRSATEICGILKCLLNYSSPNYILTIQDYCVFMCRLIYFVCLRITKWSDENRNKLYFSFYNLILSVCLRHCQPHYTPKFVQHEKINQILTHLFSHCKNANRLNYVSKYHNAVLCKDLPKLYSDCKQEIRASCTNDYSLFPYSDGGTEAWHHWSLYVCRHISFTHRSVIPFLTLLEKSGCKSEFLSLSTTSPGCALPYTPTDSLQSTEQRQKAKTQTLKQMAFR